ncbi:MAG: hypothetical protein KDK99_09190 [Verrucomicrobiales bacterium]|nr:hypothetical protein [Verrucomicrobiales bacterium]
MTRDLPMPEGCEVACRGCPHRTWDAQASERQKAAFAREKLAAWAAVMQPLIGAPPEQRWGYRQRVRLRASWRWGRWHFGMGEEERFIALPRCPVQAASVNQWLDGLGQMLPGPDRLPLHTVVVQGGITTLVARLHPTQAAAVTDELIGILAQRPSSRHGAGIFLHAHSAAGRRLFAKKGWVLLAGEPWVRGEGGLWHGPVGFQQTLPTLWWQSLQTAQAWLNPGPGDAVLDLCCGAGATLQRWAQAGAATLGVEAEAEAVAACARNAPGVPVLQGWCGTRLPQIETWWRGQTTGRRQVFANPPRIGLEPEVTAWLGEAERLDRLAYLSCSPGTLARDLAQLEAAGLRVVALQPYDFFPQTQHFEVLACLEKVGTAQSRRVTTT